MKSCDILVIGGGVIGLSLAWELRKRGPAVLVVERGEFGGEASCAAGGMLAWCDPHLPQAARELATMSAACYGEFVGEIEEASGLAVDLRKSGTIVLEEAPPGAFAEQCRMLSASELGELEPGLMAAANNPQWWPEWSLDPRRLIACLIAACRALGVEMLAGTAAVSVSRSNGRAAGIRTAGAEFSAATVVNCAGAWAGQIECGIQPSPSPTHPVKGQMLALEAHGVLKHVVRAPEVYLIPRSNGSVVVGSTLENAGFDKTTDAATIERLRAAAALLVPALRNTRIEEAWGGLRPATPDGAPILGETSLPGYFVASGHYRDGILLAPATARVMAGLILGVETGIPAMSPKRFEIGAAVA